MPVISTAGQETFSVASLLPAAALFVLCLAALVWARLAPWADARLVIALASSRDMAAVLAATPDAAVVGPGALPGSWLVSGAGPDLAARLRSAGALLILNANGADALCRAANRQSRG